MTIFQVFGLFLIFLGVFNLLRRNAEQRHTNKWQTFWKKESASNLTLPQDISQLNYIDFSGVTLPFSLFEDELLNEYEQQILLLRDEKILNLSGFTNTELKLQYGTSHLGNLIQCDQNFIVLARTLNQWGHRLYELSHIPEAKTVLAFAVSIGSDMKPTYELLLQLYKESGDSSCINDLKRSAEKLNTLRKASILAMLERA